jgi:hypothetical protein
MNELYLSEGEKQLIVAFKENKPMFEAVRKVLLATIYHQGTVKSDEIGTDYNWAFSIVNGEPKTDELIGQEVRASCTALGYLKSGFDRLSTIKLDEKKKVKTNPAI